MRRHTRSALEGSRHLHLELPGRAQPGRRALTCAGVVLCGGTCAGTLGATVDRQAPSSHRTTTNATRNNSSTTRQAKTYAGRDESAGREPGIRCAALLVRFPALLGCVGRFDWAIVSQVPHFFLLLFFLFPSLSTFFLFTMLGPCHAQILLTWIIHSRSCKTRPSKNPSGWAD